MTERIKAKRPCKRCGSLDRYPSGGCPDCVKIRYETDRRYREASLERSRRRGAIQRAVLAAVRTGIPGARLRRKRPMNRTERIQRNRELWAARKDEINVRRKLHLALNPEASRRKRETGKRWATRNTAYITAKTRLRKEIQRNRAPRWLTKAQRAEMREFYRRARDYSALTGITYHVDHIVPLVGEGVCGLHVPWNLRVIPAVQNMRKGRRLESPHEQACSDLAQRV